MEEEKCSQLLEEDPPPIFVYYLGYLVANSDENSLLGSAAFANLSFSKIFKNSLRS